MSIDVIRIALAYLTDWAKFEQIATEMMRDSGYSDIRPLGGQGDGGKDAVVERFYSFAGKRTVTIFQFTLRKDVLEKIKATIKRLNEGGNGYDKLILVTTASIGAEKQDAIKKEIRKAYGLDLEIYENKALLTYLSDLENGLFFRVFPDARRQVEALVTGEKARRDDSAQARESEFLKVCCAFSFNPAARKTRKTLIDQTVLSLFWMEPERSMTAESALARADELLGRGVLADVGQVNAAISRLKEEHLIDIVNSGYQITSAARVFIEGAHTEMEATAEAAIGDIIADVIQAQGESISDIELEHLAKNARTVLIEYFRLNGLELANTILSGELPVLVYGQALDRLREMSSRQLSASLGNLLFNAVGRALTNPTADQSKYFANCSKAYLSFQVMNLDPALREFQSTRIANKVFLLDTDFVIDAVIQELPKSAIYRNLVNQLLAMGATVLVPEEVLREVATHFLISVGTYDYCDDYLNSLTEELLDERVFNALVKGYWYFTGGTGCYREGFLRYRRNYYDDKGTEAFVADVVAEALPGVSLRPVADALGVDIDEETVEPVRKVMLELAEASGKGLHRTDQQNIHLASIDALLMLSVSRFNESAAKAAKVVLGKNSYIITASGRYIRAAQRLGSDLRVSSRPHILAGLIEMFAPSGLTDRQFVALFENPIMHVAIGKSWADISVLIAAGIELRGISVTRLRHDVETRLHEKITAVRSAEDEDTKVDKQIELVAEAEKQGYKPSPVVATLMSRDMTAQEKIRRLDEQNEILRDAIKRFGKKKDRWLKRFDQTGKK